MSSKDKKRKGSAVFIDEPFKTLRMTPSNTAVTPPDVASSYFSLDQDDDNEANKIIKKMLVIDEESVGKLLTQNSNLIDSLNQLKKVVNNLTEHVFNLKEQISKQDRKIAQLKRQMDEEHPPKYPASTESKWDRSPSYIN
jgi:septal ring factor EnvC (AmiA/AmiB activator)